ncbi:MAG: flagellar protein FlgN [Candidatus Competibacteraceae bacterium]|nr:flagellar protein FlgN [Candidatus Competibacteraceae bacterium]
MLPGLLQEEAQATQRLLEVLTREFQALKSGRPEALESVTGEKQACIEALQTQALRRVQHLSQQGLPKDSAGLEAYIRQLQGEQHRDLQQHWARLLESTQAARRQNEINGAIITASRQHTERALMALRGPRGNTCTYGQDARARFAAGPSRRLGEA